MKKSIISIALMVIVTIVYPVGSKSIFNLSSATNYQIITPEIIAGTQTPIPSDNEKNDSYLETRINSLESMLKIQSETYSATISRWESNLNLIITMIGIASVLITLLGIITFRYWIKNQINEQYKKISIDELNSLVRKEIDKIREKWDQKFADLYDDYRKIIKGK